MELALLHRIRMCGYDGSWNEVRTDIAPRGATRVRKTSPVERNKTSKIKWHNK